MDATKLYDMLHKRPFEPFRVHLSDGRVFDIRYPEMNRIWGSSMRIGIVAPDDTDPDPFPDYLETVPLALITRVEPLPANPITPNL